MKPQEKAKLLLVHFLNTHYNMRKDIAKQCAIIAVDEIILEMPMIIGEPNIKRLYWQEVKKELEKL
jgi:hypothetical protein